ncbi:hypothetical protein, partial [Aeromonas salmonicida]|uniref:hypothetical protein n=1 Tax=Aeromonas salmonicida TaxID=645 RepID=UPI003D312925
NYKKKKEDNRKKNSQEVVGSVRCEKETDATQAIDKAYGKMTTHSFDRIEDALRCVPMEVCDVVVLPLRVAKYYINSKFPDSLLVT